MTDVDGARKIIRLSTASGDASRDGMLSALSDSSLLVRVTATIQLALGRIASVPDRNIGEIAELLLKGRPAALDHGYAEANAENGGFRDLEQDLAMALAALPAGSADFAIVPLIERWRTDLQFYELVLAAIAQAFGPSERRSAAGLTEKQRQVLDAVMSSEAIWNCCGDTVPLLAERGLPQNRETMRVFLAGHET